MYMIKRRKAIQNLAIGVGALISFPSWAKGWNRNSLRKVSILNFEENLLLDSIVDTIIPATNTPGAKDVGVASLIQLILKDCQPKAVQDHVRMGLVTTNAVAISQYGKSFVDLSASEKLAVLKSMASSEYPDQKNFLNQIKGMTINAYTQSEYFLTNVAKFEMAPNRYIGCVKA